jgi:hypothetical protein
MAATGTLITGEELLAALGSPDVDTDQLDQVAAAANDTILLYLKDGDWSEDAACKEAALTIAQQLWQARQAPGGQMVQMDYGTVAMPHLVGPGLIKRVTGLLGPRMVNGGTNFA